MRNSPEIRASVRKPSVHTMSHDPSSFSHPARNTDAMQTHPVMIFKNVFIGYNVYVLLRIKGGLRLPAGARNRPISLPGGPSPKRTAEIHRHLDCGVRSVPYSRAYPRPPLRPATRMCQHPHHFHWDSAGVSPACGIKVDSEHKTRGIPPRPPLPTAFIMVGQKGFPKEGADEPHRPAPLTN